MPSSLTVGGIFLCELYLCGGGLYDLDSTYSWWGRGDDGVMLFVWWVDG